MIPYAELERAIARWKSRSTENGAPQGETIAPAEEEPRPRIKSSLDWSMDQALGTTTSQSSSDAAEPARDGVVEESQMDEIQTKPVLPIEDSDVVTGDLELEEDTD